MKEEGFLNRALAVVKEDDMSARFLANQSLFNGAAHNATTQGDIRQVISEAYGIMPKNLDPV